MNDSQNHYADERQQTKNSSYCRIPFYKNWDDTKKSLEIKQISEGLVEWEGEEKNHNGT